MNRYAPPYLSERLMTVEEAERLSTLDGQCETRDERARKPSIWAWQTVDGVLAQTVTDEQVEQALRTRRR